MCGIVGYVGKRNAQDVLLDGLEKLEYRGYDSAGVALALEGGIRVVGTHPRHPTLHYNLGCNGVGFLPSIYLAAGVPVAASLSTISAETPAGMPCATAQ